jgi:N-ethylmaleimide reductase
MDLFSAFALGPLQLDNRIVMAPMTRSRAVGGMPNELMRTYYTQRASAGLIVTEGVAPSPNALGYARIPGLFSPAQVEGWSAVTRSVHEAGGCIFAQLMHVGRIAHAHNLPERADILAPSAVAAAGAMWTDAAGPQPLPVPKEMSASDLRVTRQEFVRAAQNAIRAGMDGIELHGANGYLLEQFLHPHTNRRSDEYGGSIEGRIRFVVEVAKAAAEAIGAERVGMRLSPYSTFNDLPPHADVQVTYAALARELRGLVYLHVIENLDPGFAATARAIRAAFAGTVILNGGFDRSRAEAALRAGQAELVAFGVPFIANPDLVQRMQQGAPLAAPNPASFYTPGAEGYVDYPALPGHEAREARAS